MYKVLEVEDKVRVPPNKFHLSLEEAIKSSLEEIWEGVVEKNAGIILSIVSIEKVGEGKILPGDGGIYYPVRFKILSYKPELYEIVKGNVIDITEFGVFIRIGPVDGMIHVSQIMDDFVSYDPKNSVFTGKETRNIIREGDVVLARIISLSLGSDNRYKIGLTTRQPGLGVIEWIEKAKKEKGEKTEKKSKKKK